MSIREVLEREALVIFRRNHRKKSEALANRQWASHFGTSLEVCVILWEKIKPERCMPRGASPKHLLWGLYLLKVYGTGDTSSSNVGGVDDKTWRKWTELFVDALSILSMMW